MEMTTLPIPELELSRLEREVRRRMARGQWQKAILHIRETASALGVSSDDLVKAVARVALEKGHVQPLPMEPMQ